MARGWTSRAVALASWAVTLFLAAIALRTWGRGSATANVFLLAGVTAAAFAAIDRFRPHRRAIGGATSRPETNFPRGNEANS